MLCLASPKSRFRVDEFFFLSFFLMGFPGGSAGKESAYNAGDLDLIPGMGRSPEEGNGYPLQYSGLENSMDCVVHGVAELDRTERLSFSLSFFIKQALSWRFRG